MNELSVPQNREDIVVMWRKLNRTQQIAVFVITIAALVAVVSFVMWAQTPQYAVAFTEVSGEDGAAIITYLQESNIPYEVSGNGQTISVPADQVHEIRLNLAGQGLPSEGSVGFEIFDATNLGMTDFTQQVNYQRALEGELSRTISSLEPINNARVHVAIPQQTLFTDNQNPTTASVTVELAQGQQLNQEQINSIVNLVSSSVEGLSEENITIADTNGNILYSGAADENSDMLTVSANQLETQRRLELEIADRVQSMLDTVLGPDKAVVRVAADMNWDQVERESQFFAPQNPDSAIRSAHLITESYAGIDDGAGGIPGTASNIPDAAPSFQTSITDTNGVNYGRVDLTYNYEVSQTNAYVKEATGTIERLSVSVLVDTITETEVISALHAATIAAAGLNQVRGDVVTVNSIPFDRSAADEQEIAIQSAQQQNFYLDIARWAIVIIAMVALFLVVRGLLQRLQPQAVGLSTMGEMAAAGAGAGGAPGLAGAAGMPPGDARSALLEEVDRMAGGQGAMGMGVEGAEGDLGMIGPPSFDEEAMAGAEKAQMLRQLQLAAKNRPETLAQIVQFWLSEDQNKGQR